MLNTMFITIQCYYKALMIMLSAGSYRVPLFLLKQSSPLFLQKSQVDLSQIVRTRAEPAPAATN